MLGVEELESPKQGGPIREQLATWSAATGQQTAVLNSPNVRRRSEFEQILYTNADGSVLILTNLRPGANATIVHDGRATSIPWSPISPSPPGSRTPSRTVARVIADQTPSLLRW